MPTVALIGSGNLAQALGPALREAGYRILNVVHRDGGASRRRALSLAKKLGANVVPIGQVRPDADLIWLCYNDDALTEGARVLARKPGWNGKIAFHSSGALTSEVLAPLRHAGASIASVHPMMTFVPGAGARVRFGGVTFGVEGDPRAVAAAGKVARRLGAHVASIKKRSKALYHALGSFASPLLIATLATAERLGQAAGLSAAQSRRMIGPLVEQTIRNYLRNGASAAFSGPVQRGDVNTIRQHLRALRSVKGVNQVYCALVKSALRELPAKNAGALKSLLDKQN